MYDVWRNKKRKLLTIGVCRTPYLWPKSDEPRYAIALGASAGFSMATAALAWWAKAIMLRRNKALRASESETRNFYVY